MKYMFCPDYDNTATYPEKHWITVEAPKVRLLRKIAVAITSLLLLYRKTGDIWLPGKPGCLLFIIPGEADDSHLWMKIRYSYGRKISPSPCRWSMTHERAMQLVELVQWCLINMTLFGPMEGRWL